MEGFGPRWLILFAVTAAVAAATPAGAEERKKAAQDGATYLTSARPGPSYQRVVVTSSTPRRAHEPLPHGVYSPDIAAASERYAVPERLFEPVLRACPSF